MFGINLRVKQSKTFSDISGTFKITVVFYRPLPAVIECYRENLHQVWIFIKHPVSSREKESLNSLPALLTYNRSNRALYAHAQAPTGGRIWPLA